MKPLSGHTMRIAPTEVRMKAPTTQRFAAGRRSPPSWLALLGFASVCGFLVMVRRALSNSDFYPHQLSSSSRSETPLFTRPASHWVQHLMDGASRPAGVSMKEFMYECFKRDVARGELGENRDILRDIRVHRREGRSLRMVSWNVHFFSVGYSNVVLGDGLDEAKAVISLLHADVLLLQEVPPSVLGKLEKWLLDAEGYTHFVAAPSADPHVLAADSSVYAGERLLVLIASKRPFRQSAQVAMANGGHAAFAEIELRSAAEGSVAAGRHHGRSQGSSPSSAPLSSSSSSTPPATALVYSLHASVRCAASVRREEIGALLLHAQSLNPSASASERPSLIAGDFNQPNEADYPPHEWHALASDLASAKLPESDGVMQLLRAAGYVPSWEVASLSRPLVGSSAWNGAVVDYCYVANVARGLRGRHLPTTMVVEATYMHHSLASDHLPLVVDFRI